MVDPFSIISLIEGSISLVVQCGSVIKTLKDFADSHKQARITIMSMVQEIDTIELACSRIVEWSQNYAATTAGAESVPALDFSIFSRLGRSLECGTMVMSAL